MKIVNAHIQNYKSLRDIRFQPSDLTTIIGPNGSGKSNVNSSFSFLADVYGNGLEFAVANKGGYENIAFRRQRRTKSAISFEVEIEFTPAETRRILVPLFVRDHRTIANRSLKIKHNFSIKAAKQGIRSDFSIEEEFVQAELHTYSSNNESASELLLKIKHVGKKITHALGESQHKDRFASYLKFLLEWRKDEEVNGTNLMIGDVFSKLGSILKGIAVFQFSPQICRSPGAPSPQPQLSSYGQNLPSLIDWLQRNHPKKWEWVQTTMRQIVPRLENISTEYLHTKTLGLSFKEEGFGRSWTAEDVSDGTIQALAILVSVADPRNEVIVIDEPENSLHPWIVRQLANEIKALSKSTQIILTTHSPIILNLVDPNDIWVCYKKNAATHLTPLFTLAPELKTDWENGENRLFDLLDLGIVQEALPGGAE